MFVDGLHTGKKFRVECHIVLMLCQNWAELLRQGFHLRIRIGTHQAGENIRHPVEQVVIVLALRVICPGNGIVERRLVGVANDFGDGLVVTANSFEKSGLKVLEMYLVERHCVVKCAVRLHKGVGPHRCRLYIFLIIFIFYAFHILHKGRSFF